MPGSHYLRQPGNDIARLPLEQSVRIRLAAIPSLLLVGGPNGFFRDWLLVHAEWVNDVVDRQFMTTPVAGSPRNGLPDGQADQRRPDRRENRDLALGYIAD